MTAGTPHKALYRRWRAQTFSEIVGQEAVVATLRNAVATGQVSHAILFTGPRGTGKTSLARILAKALNCTKPAPNADPCDACPSCVAIREGTTLDVLEIDAASNRGIDNIRELRERIPYPPGELRRKVYILDEAHQITKDAWNALLKSLEEPPDFVSFMFASTHPQGFPPAILSRLQRFDVRRLTVPEITGKLERILAADGREADPEAVAVVARLAAGGMRDAESILDQLLSSTAGVIEADAVRDLLGLADADLVGGFTDALAAGDAAAGIGLLDRLEERGRDLRVFLDQVVDALRERLLAGIAGGGGAEPGVAAAARRLAGIDPTRLGPGGLRLQLELALLEPGLAFATTAGPIAAATRATVPPPNRPGPAARRPEPEPDQRPEPAPEPEPAPRREPEPAQRPEPAPEPEPDPRPEPELVPRPEPARSRRPAPAYEFGRSAPADEGEPAPEPAPLREPAPVHAPTGADAPLVTLVDTRETAADDPAPGQGRAVPVAPLGPVGAADAAGAGDLDRLRRGWTSVVTTITERNRAVKPLISACRPIGVEGNIVTLGFPEEQGFLKDVADRRRPLLEECIGGYLGHDVGVRCIATNLDLVPPLPDDQEAERILAEAHRIFADDRLDAPEVT